MRKKKVGLLMFVLACLLFSVSCGSGNPSGKYGHAKNQNWEMELLESGKGFLSSNVRESFDYSVEGNTIIISHIVGGARGTIDGNTITFPQAKENDIVGMSFEGVWTRK